MRGYELREMEHNLSDRINRLRSRQKDAGPFRAAGIQPIITELKRQREEVRRLLKTWGYHEER